MTAMILVSCDCVCVCVMGRNEPGVDRIETDAAKAFDPADIFVIT